MECLYNNFQAQPQYIDSCLKDIMISLLQLGDQYVVTPQIILKLLPYSYISAPYLSIYLPELFINHPNVQAQACSYYFALRKYGFQLAKGQTSVNQQQFQYFVQYLPIVAGYIMNTMERSAEISLFRSTLRQNYTQQINYQLNRAKAVACCALSRLDDEA